MKSTTVNRCTTPRCKRKAVKKQFCAICYTKNWRSNNPIAAAYLNLKSNSKRRGIFFDLTLEEFTRFCYKEQYIENKGKTADSYSIDRKIESRGYTASNIQILTLAANTSKEQTRRKMLLYDWQTKEATVMKCTRATGDDLPF